MPTLHIDADDLRRLLDGATIQHPVTGLRVELDKEAIDMAMQLTPAAAPEEPNLFDCDAPVWPALQSPKDAEGNFIDITPRGMMTPEGNQRVNEALDARNNVTAELANAATQFVDNYRTVILDGLNNPLINSDGRAALRDDLHQLDALIGARRRKEEAFLRAVAGVPA